VSNVVEKTFDSLLKWSFICRRQVEPSSSKDGIKFDLVNKLGYWYKMQHRHTEQEWHTSKEQWWRHRRGQHIVQRY